MQSSAIARLALLFGGALLVACGQAGDPAPPYENVARTAEALPDPVPEIMHVEAAEAVPPPVSLEANVAVLAGGDDEAAREGFLALAQRGDAEAQFQLARMLGDGRGGPKSEAEALQWLRKAADQGHAEAQTLWGAVVLWGEQPVTPEELSLGLASLRRAATRHDRDAMAALALMYANDSRFRDPVEAAYWNDELDKLDAIAEARARNEAGIAETEQRIAEIDERLRALDAAERANAATVLARGPEPSEAEMRSALEDAMQADSGTTRIDNGVATGMLSIKQFQKHGCEPAEGAAGYYCKYLIEPALEMQANDGGGVNWNGFLEAILVPQNLSGRFVYDAALQRWERFDE